jgi:hypothetical protein
VIADGIPLPGKESVYVFPTYQNLLRIRSPGLPLSARPLIALDFGDGPLVHLPFDKQSIPFWHVDGNRRFRNIKFALLPLYFSPDRTPLPWFFRPAGLGSLRDFDFEEIFALARMSFPFNHFASFFARLTPSHCADADCAFLSRTLLELRPDGQVNLTKLRDVALRFFAFLRRVGEFRDLDDRFNRLMRFAICKMLDELRTSEMWDVYTAISLIAPDLDVDIEAPPINISMGDLSFVSDMILLIGPMALPWFYSPDSHNWFTELGATVKGTFTGREIADVVKRRATASKTATSRDFAGFLAFVRELPARRVEVPIRGSFPVALVRLYRTEREKKPEVPHTQQQGARWPSADHIFATEEAPISMPSRPAAFRAEEPVITRPGPVTQAPGRRPPPRDARRSFREALPEAPQPERALAGLAASAGAGTAPTLPPALDVALGAASAPLVAPPGLPTVQKKAFNPLTITFKK